MAGQYNIEGDILAQGINAIIRVNLDSPDNGNVQEIGFVESYSIRMNITNQRAECIGQLLPVAIDPTGVSVTVSLTGFIPIAELAEKGIEDKNHKKKVFLKAFLPDVSNLEGTHLITKIPYLELWDDKHGEVIGYTTWLVPASYQDGGQGKGYVKADVSLEGIGYNNGSAYKSLI